MVSEIRRSLGEWRVSIIQKWWDMLNIPVSAIPLVYGLIQVYRWSRTATPPLPTFDLAMVLIGLVMFIGVSFWSFHQMRMQRDKLRIHDAMPDSEIKLMEWRKEVRKAHTDELTQIPPTLKKIWVIAHDSLETKKKTGCPKQTLLEIILDVLDVKRDDKVLKATQFNTAAGIRKSIKLIKAKMNLRKSNPAIEAQWRLRIADAMDAKGVGLDLKHNQQYTEMTKQLETECEPISRTKVSKKIDVFLDNLSIFYNIQLLRYYEVQSGEGKDLHLFPREFRLVMEHLEDGVEREMRTKFVQVREVLEDYSIGDKLKEEQAK